MEGIIYWGPRMKRSWESDAVSNWHERQSTRLMDDWGCMEAQSSGTVSRRSWVEYSHIRDMTGGLAFRLRARKPARYGFPYQGERKEKKTKAKLQRRQVGTIADRWFLTEMMGHGIHSRCEVFELRGWSRPKPSSCGFHSFAHAPF